MKKIDQSPLITLEYPGLLTQISDTYTAGQVRAEYGKALLKQLARDLTLRHGKGFSRSNLVYRRLLYQRYPISQKPSHQLSWSHYVELLKLDDELERGFYERQAIAERWSVPELKRQKASSLFLRLAASKDKSGIRQLVKQGQMVEQPALCTEVSALPARSRRTAAAIRNHLARGGK